MPKTITCPENSFFDDDAKKCYIPKFRKKNTICSAPEKLVNNVCSLVETHVPHNVCKVNSIFDEDKCITKHITDPIFLCREDFTLTSRQCTRAVKSEPSLFCEKGLLINDQCVEELSVPVMYSCPDNTELTSTKQCSQTLHEIPKMTCQMGYTLNTSLKQCEKKSVIKLPYEEQHKIKKQGLLKGSVDLDEYIQTKLKCPIGYYQTSSFECESLDVVDVKKLCPPDYLLMSKTDCIQRKVFEASAACPIGFELTGNTCLSTVITEPSLLCTNNTILSDGMCLSVEIDTALVSCAEGYALQNDGTCVSLEITSPSVECVDGYYLTEEKGEKLCMKVTRAGILEDCNDTELDIDGFCMKKEYVEGITSCSNEDEVYESDRGCIRIRESKPLVVCEEGYTLINDKCLKKLFVEQLSSCPSNTMLDSNGKCSRFERITAEPVCVYPYEYDPVRKECVSINLLFEFDHEAYVEPVKIEAKKDLQVKEPEQEILPVEEIPKIEKRVKVPVVSTAISIGFDEYLLTGEKDLVEEKAKLIEKGVEVQPIPGVSITKIKENEPENTAS